MSWLGLLHLKSSNPETRLQAVHSLADSASARAIAALMHAFEDEDSRVATAAATALGKLGGDEAILFLLRNLQAVSPELRRLAADALKDQNEERVTIALVGALQDNDAGVRGRAARYLERRGWKPAAPREQILLYVARGQMGEAAALGPEAIEPLERVLQTGQYNLQVAALHALGKISDERVLNLLVPALKSPDHAVVVAAIEALCNAGGPKAADAVLTTLESPDHRVRVAGTEAVARLEVKNAAQALSALLKDSMWDVRRAAATALGKVKDPQAVEGLITALRDSDPDVREAAIASVGRVRDPRAVGPLVLALVDPEIGVRRAATYTLPQLDSRWAQSDEARRQIPELRAAMNADDSGVRYAASTVLKQLGDSGSQALSLDATSFLTVSGHKQRRVFAMFMELLTDADRDVRLAAVETLGRLGDKRAASALMTALSDSDESVKRAANRSLEALGT
jgi:HEAT repeat protein